MSKCFSVVATRQVAELGSSTWQLDDLSSGPYFFISDVTTNCTYVNSVKQTLFLAYTCHCLNASFLFPSCKIEEPDLWAPHRLCDRHCLAPSLL